MFAADGHRSVRPATGRGAGRPRVLLYCHHSVGLGHLVRTLAIAQALADRFDVVLASGGPVPAGLPTPAGVRVVALAPVGADESGQLTSLDPLLTLDQAWRARRELLVALVGDLRPAAVVVELFPFGRRKFAPEIIALLEAVRSRCIDTPVVCSVRDLLVTGHQDKQRHDDETAERLNRYFDAVIVHADPAFVRLEQTFTPRLGVGVPVEYSGFVCSRSGTPAVPSPQRAQVVVSVGGGKVGADLLRAAVAAHRSDLGPRGLTTVLVTGPFLPVEVYAELEAAAKDDPCLVLNRFVPDLCALMAGSAVSVSQCGYNTAIDILRSGVPAVVVPFDGGGETEQRQRAQRLAEMGVVSVVPVAQLTGPALAAAILERVSCRRVDARLRLDGASVTAGIVEDLVRRTSSIAGVVAS